MSSELACTYAALILNDDGIDITADKLTAILKVHTSVAFTRSSLARTNPDQKNQCF